MLNIETGEPPVKDRSCGKKQEGSEMSKIQIIGQPSLPDMPWEDRPEGNTRPLWRYSANPIIDWNPLPTVARAFNSAVIPYGDGYVGVFRMDHHNCMPHLHFGSSPDLGIGPEPRSLPPQETPDPSPVSWSPASRS